MCANKCRTTELGICGMMVGLFLSSGPWSAVLAQQASNLPSDWQQLSPRDFVAAVETARDRAKLSETERSSVQSHARLLLDEIDLAQSTENYVTLNGLYELATPRFEQLHARADLGGQEGPRQALLARVEDWADRPYEEVRAKAYLMHWLKASEEEVVGELRQWVAAGGAVEEVWPEDLNMVRHALSNYREITGSCNIRFTCSVTAPRTGDYTFSISPVNTNVQEYRYHHRADLQQRLTVTVGGQAVLTATPDDWVTESAPVSLTAGEAIPLQYDLQVDSPQLPRFALSALLFWEGPGVAKMIVPESRLTPPDGDGQGLQMTVNWDEEGEPQTVTQTVPAIDFAWCESRIRIFDDPIFQAQLHEAAWEKCTSDEYLDQLVTSGRLHPFLFDPHLTDPIDAVGCFTTAQQTQFLDILAARPSLLDPVELEQARDLYRAFRFSNPDRALNVLGLWATRHSDLPCILPNGTAFFGFNYYNCRDFRQLGQCVTTEIPEHAERLQDEFLELNDGGCCLPVAYTLAYSYQGKGRFNDWIEFLETKLAQEGLVGEPRVNWLLARAHAQEIRLCPSDFYADGVSRPLDGRRWITEAKESATTPETRVRVGYELAARLTATSKFDDALTVMAEAGNGVPVEVQVQVNEAIDAISRFKDWNVQLAQKNAQLSQDNYITKLRERRDRANNAETAARYDALLQQATSGE